MIYAINTDTLGISKYNITDHLITSFEDNLIGIESTALHVFEETTDNGEEILSYVETGWLDFGSEQLKRFPTYSIYISLSEDAEVELVAYASNNGVTIDHVYFENKTMYAYDEERFGVYDGIRSRYWKFKLQNKNGSKIALNNWALYPAVSNRRIR